ncbi:MULTISPECIES: hypothetical protein [Marinomonas]|uniref:Uncharacterized protein n=1 Tax=Marinomonas aquiplantarum TaxID=491951 RepID=A0A366D0H5_9GAMM|nr:hypothetical protein [Marinomonas aquiplantarum]RBO83436.1 hypothetical protein DFP76_104255 [Marinomonas aquiplantarum]
MELSQAELTIVMFILSAVVGGLGGFLAFLFNRISANERGLMQHKIDAAEKYAHKNEINDLAGRLERKIEDLFKQVYDAKK